MANRRNAQGKLETVSEPIAAELLSGPNAGRVVEHGLPPTTRAVNRQAKDQALNNLWGHKAALADYEQLAEQQRSKVRQAEEWIRREQEAIQAWENELARLEE